MRPPLVELLDWVRENMPMEIDVCLSLEMKLKEMIRNDKREDKKKS